MSVRKVADYIKDTIEEELRPSLFSKEQLPERIEKSRLEQTKEDVHS